MSIKQTYIVNFGEKRSVFLWHLQVLIVTSVYESLFSYCFGKGWVGMVMGWGG